MHWTISKIIQTFAFSILATLISLVLVTPGMTNPADVRVLVDVSGSMKKADPKAVRGPATALLAALLPDRSRGGIWLFGSDVRELVPYGPVDARWDALGKPIEASIGSTDRFTHIESAVRTGIRAGGQPVSGVCHVILITDGIVDVRGGKDASSISRDRIIKSLLPEASDRNCRIHTIALSDEADLPLLRQMALQTGGLFTLLDRPGDLIPVMLDALELALRSQQLPIRDQQIKIDPDIRQLRLIRLNSESDIALKTDSKVINSTSENTNIVYYKGTGYQTLIWSNPTPDRYTLTSDLGPTDRILIDSDVRLELTELPPTISSDQTLGLSASVISKNGQITAPDREFHVAFGSHVDPVRSRGNELSIQIDSPTIGRSILTVQSFDKKHERQIQRAFEVLETQPALEIATDSSKGVGQVVSSVKPKSQDAKTLGKAFEGQALLPEIVKERLPEDMLNWPLWQLAVSALAAIGVIALVVGLVLRPKNHLPE
jgi:hypothetical protein